MGRGDGGYARIRYDLVRSLIQEYGKSAYTVALERIHEHEDETTQKIWKDVLNDLDEHFKGEEE